MDTQSKCQRNWRRTQLSTLIALGLGTACLTVQAAPSKPQLSYDMTNVKNQSFVEINGEAGRQSYKKAVIRRDSVSFPVKWDIWYNSGTPATKWQVKLGDKVVFTEAINGPQNQAFSGATEVQIDKAGQYDMTVNVCDASGDCSSSDVHKITVTDTDGAGMAPLTMNVDSNNQSFPPQPDGTVVGSYFVEWSQYDRKFSVDNIPAENLTHIIYGFIPMCGPNASLTDNDAQTALKLACGDSKDYEVVVHDQWGAFGSSLPGTANSSIKGTYGQMMALKQRYPELKILPSIGGWTLSDPFYGFTNKANRDTFVASVKEFLLTWKFYDGVDIDWEFPGGDGANTELGNPDLDGQAYVDLMKELRNMLDQLSAETGKTYELTSAIGAGWDKIEDVDYSDAQQYMDYIFVMSYDFYGAWSTNLGHQAALECGSHISQGQCDGTEDPDGGPEYTTHNAATQLLEQGVSPSKLVLGAAMYGRGWKGVTRDSMTDPQNPMTGSGVMSGDAVETIDGSWEKGVIDYKDIVTDYLGQPGVEYHYDQQAQAPYIYKESTGELITYDNAQSVEAKAAYARSHGFAGLFSWEIDGDNGDILNAMQNGLLNGGEGVNRPPVADAGEDKLVTEAGVVNLDGSRSHDAEGEVSYLWEQIAGPTIAINNANSAVATITIGDDGSNNVYSFKLTVTDQDGVSAYDTMKVTTQFTTEPENRPPEAVITGPVEADAGERVTLDASGSSDPDGDSLTYSWSSADVTLNANGSSASFIAPEFTQDTNITVSVTVSDGSATDTKSLTILVKAKEDGGTGGSCSTTDPEASNVPAWVRGQVYTTETVSHNGLVYTAKWWNTEEPTPTASAWNLDSEVELPWTSAAVYNGGDQVDHNGSRWEAKWWTQGNEPSSSSDVWVNVGDAHCQ
ncbi:chitinase [Vibrio zhanjiangensis]|uniref:chitinase n=1 Tax=Vibrio zhanjiangensis TaxID=1046128 RepID=A0ABQ6F4Z8_9VIBR|nr:glycosyl hydrolase family 18 protein [Vibrio zhanjiangensis]GLT20044.1 chitinase [Vibrio zhanjiangensis]